MDKLTERLLKAQENNNNLERSKLIEEYMPFIMSETSKATGSYITLENSQEISAALAAFDEAIDRYSPEKGAFIKLASLTIDSRIKDLQRKEAKHEGMLSIHDETVINLIPIQDNKLDLKIEVGILNDTLRQFGLDLEDIVDESPTHADVRDEMVDLAKVLSTDSGIVGKIYDKKVLPMNEIIGKYNVTKKKLKYHRKFLIFAVIIFHEQLDSVMEFMI